MYNGTQIREIDQAENDMRNTITPKRLPKKFHSRVMHWDDERNIGNYILITLDHGWRTEGTDINPNHTICAYTIKEGVEYVRDAVSCNCKECKENT